MKRPSATAPRRDSPDRGQTTIDFAIGVGVFMLVLAFTVTFIPGMIEPFVSGTSEPTVAANRVADALANGMLADPNEPRVLGATCTVAFFDDSISIPAECNYEQTNDLRARTGIQGRPAGTGFGLRVTIVGEDADGDGDPDLLCGDDAPAATFGPESGAACDPGAGDTVLEIQTGSPPTGSSSVVAQRGVYIAHGSGADGTLRVEVWS